MPTPEEAFAIIERQEIALQRLLKDNGSLWNLFQQQHGMVTSKLDRITACVAMLEDSRTAQGTLKALPPLPAATAAAVLEREGTKVSGLSTNGQGLGASEARVDPTAEILRKIDELNILVRTRGQALPLTPRDKVATPRNGKEDGKSKTVVEGEVVPFSKKGSKESKISAESKMEPKEEKLMKKTKSGRMVEVPDDPPEEAYHSADKEPKKPAWCLERFVSSQMFEMVFAVLIVGNTFNMCAEAEYRGWGTGHTIGFEGAVATTETADKIFEMIEYTFTIVFTAEVVLKLLALWCGFWKSGWNLFDFSIIAIAWFDLLLKVDFPLNPMILRLVRLLRLLRMLRTMRKFEVFDTLFMMVNGIKASIPVLMWVCLLVFPILVCCGLAMNYMLVDFINDLTRPEADRVQCYKYFGTFTRSMVSMFEVTFASFIPINRFMYQKVDEKYAIFFMGYKLVVGIAVIRIIYGVFLHVSFACAASDEEALIAQKDRENKKYERRLLSLFNKLDVNNNGEVTREEFMPALQDPAIKTYLQALGLDVHDAELVFNLTDNGDGAMEAQEMLYGFSRLRGNARSIDVMALIKQNEARHVKVEEDLARIISKLE